jgi:hypothetical protein
MSVASKVLNVTVAGLLPVLLAVGAVVRFGSKGEAVFAFLTPIAIRLMVVDELVVALMLSESRVVPATA